MEKNKESLERKISALEAQRGLAEEEKNKIISKNNMLEKEIFTVRKEATLDKKLNDTLKREKEMLTKAAQKATGSDRCNDEGNYIMKTSHNEC